MATYQLVQNRTDGSNNNVPFTIPDEQGTYKLTAKLSNGTEIDMGNVIVDSEQHEYKIKMILSSEDKYTLLSTTFTVDGINDIEQYLNNIQVTFNSANIYNVSVQNISPQLQQWCSNNGYYIKLVLVKYIPHGRSHGESSAYWRRGLSIRFSERANQEDTWGLVGTNDNEVNTFNGNGYYKFPNAVYLVGDTRSNSPFTNVNVDDHFIDIDQGNGEYSIRYMIDFAIMLTQSGLENILPLSISTYSTVEPYIRFGLMPVLTKDTGNNPLNGAETRGKNICWFKCDAVNYRIIPDVDFVSKSER